MLQDRMLEVVDEGETEEYERLLRIRYLTNVAIASVLSGAASWFLNPFGLASMASLILGARALVPIAQDFDLRRWRRTRSALIIGLCGAGALLGLGSLALRLMYAYE